MNRAGRLSAVHDDAFDCEEACGKQRGQGNEQAHPSVIPLCAVEPHGNTCLHICAPATLGAARSAEHTVALTPDDVITWGENGDGQCGQGERAERGCVKPRSIKPLQGLHVTQVVCGRFHTLCVTATSQARPPRWSGRCAACCWPVTHARECIS